MQTNCMFAPGMAEVNCFHLEVTYLSVVLSSTLVTKFRSSVFLTQWYESWTDLE